MKRIRMILLAAVLLPAWAAADGDAPEILSASLELGGGWERYDNPAIFINDFDFIEVGSRSARSDSPYVSLALGLDVDLPLAGGRAWIATLDAELRRSPNLPELDQDRVKFATGPQFSLGAGEASVQATADELVLGGGDFRRHGRGLLADYTWHGGEARHKSSLQWTRFRHDGADDLFDSDRYALRHVMRGSLPADWRAAWEPTWQLRAGLARERNRWGFDDLSANEGLLELELGVTPRPAWTFSMLIGARYTRFLGPAPGEDFSRRDRRGNLLLAAQYRYTRHTALRCELEGTRRASNDPLAETTVQRIGCQMEWES